MMKRKSLQFLGKRAVAIFLAACMTAGTPATALAAESGGTEYEPSTEQESEKVTEQLTEIPIQTEVQTEEVNSETETVTEENSTDAAIQTEVLSETAGINEAETESKEDGENTENGDETEYVSETESEELNVPESETDLETESDIAGSENRSKAATNFILQKNAVTYKAADIAVINKIIDDNGLQKEKNNPEQWEADGFVTWSDSNWDNKLECFSLVLSDRNLKGNLDLRGMTGLAQVECNNNPQLTGINVEGLNKLSYLACDNNGLTELRLNNASLTALSCRGNQLERLNLVMKKADYGDAYLGDNPIKELTFNGSSPLILQNDSQIGKISITKANMAKSTVELQMSQAAGLKFIKWAFSQKVIYWRETSDTSNPVQFQMPDSGVTVTAQVEEIKQGDIDDVAKAYEALSNESLYIDQEDSENAEEILRRIIDTVKKEKIVIETGVTISPVQHEAYIHMPEKGTGENPTGVNGDFSITVTIQKGLASKDITFAGTIYAKPVDGYKSDEQCVAEAIKLLENVSYTVSEELDDSEAVNEIIKQISDIPGILETGVVFHPENSNYQVFKQAESGSLNNPKGLNGEADIYIPLSKGGTDYWYRGSVTIVATALSETDYEDLKAVNKVKEILESNTLILEQENIPSEEVFIEELLRVIYNTPGIAETGVNINKDILAEKTFISMPEKGTVGNPNGVDGRFWCDFVKIEKGKASEVIIFNGAIKATRLKGQWRRDSRGWWFSYIDGGYPKNQFEEIEGEKYYFNSNGYMKTGWQRIGGNWYYLKSSGAMATGWQRIGGAWYYLKDDGIMATGWQQVDGSWYYLKSSGAMATGWQKLGGSWYYLKSGGAMATGWQRI